MNTNPNAVTPEDLVEELDSPFPPWKARRIVIAAEHRIIAPGTGETAGKPLSR